MYWKTETSLERSLLMGMKRMMYRLPAPSVPPPPRPPILGPSIAATARDQILQGSRLQSNFLEFPGIPVSFLFDSEIDIIPEILDPSFYLATVHSVTL